MGYMIAAALAILAALIGALVFFWPGRSRLRPPDHEIYVANLGGHSILGFAIDASDMDASPGIPPSAANAAPAACTLMTRLDMLKSVRYRGFRDVMRNVH